MLIELIMNTIVQWFVLIIIPVIVYLIFFRKKDHILSFFGLKKPQKVNMSLLIKTSIICVLLLIASIRWVQMYTIETYNFNLLSFEATGWSIQTIAIILIQSVIRTALLEEIIFRGFLINTLKDKLSFTISNHIQAFLFAGLHLFAMLSYSLIDMTIGTILIYMMSLFFGKLMKESGYSIFYSVIFHGTLNVIGAIVLIVVN